MHLKSNFLHLTLIKCRRLPTHQQEIEKYENTFLFGLQKKVKLNQNNGLVHLKLNHIWFIFQREKINLFGFGLVLKLKK